MKANEARKAADDYNFNGKVRFDKKLYKTVMSGIEKAAKDGKYMCAINLWKSRDACQHIIDKLKTEGYSVSAKWNCDGVGIAGVDPEDYMRLVVRW